MHIHSFSTKKNTFDIVNFLKLSVQCSAWQKKAKLRRTNSRTNCQQNKITVCREILGGIMTQLLLRAAARGYKGKIPCVGADCDNNGVVNHGNTPHIPLTTNQTQADLLQVYKTSFRRNPSPLSINMFNPTRII
jgi:hypothetical protein